MDSPPGDLYGSVSVHGTRKEKLGADSGRFVGPTFGVPGQQQEGLENGPIFGQTITCFSKRGPQIGVGEWPHLGGVRPPKLGPANPEQGSRKI